MAFCRSLDVFHSIRRIGSRKRISRVAFIVSVLSAFSLAAAPSARKVIIGEYGKLEGALNGWAWVAPGQQTTVSFPSPCNEKGCFKNTGGKLCTKGHINALTCTNAGTPQVSCNWDKNWGVVLGMNPGAEHVPWGTSAPMHVAVDYTSATQGGTAGHYRLNAHVAGDPYSKQYCIDNYTPGAAVQASDFKTQCWFNTGDPLPTFRAVDTLGLLRTSEYAPVDFDFCVTGISTD